ncbi:hypothetical protein SCP_0705780 [Sparassis crispa]|uniref:Uncharacterized protein n=1 Tax=Sparassis crispa TaxID=139825 RepID=A0A401GT24_9APHY|nr:hypothetical protein SCP_0705780 [Sparassis crispa]GBE85391.1 hypothetical protein SCP_0705780 [Sparassis crispa]
MATTTPPRSLPSANPFTATARTSTFRFYPRRHHYPALQACAQARAQILISLPAETQQPEASALPPPRALAAHGRSPSRNTHRRLPVSRSALTRRAPDAGPRGLARPGALPAQDNGWHARALEEESRDGLPLPQAQDRILPLSESQSSGIHRAPSDTLELEHPTSATPAPFDHLRHAFIHVLGTSSTAEADPGPDPRSAYASAGTYAVLAVPLILPTAPSHLRSNNHASFIRSSPSTSTRTPRVCRVHHAIPYAYGVIHVVEH